MKTAVSANSAFNRLGLLFLALLVLRIVSYYIVGKTSYWATADYSFEFFLLLYTLYSREQPNRQEQAKDYRFYLIVAALTLWTFKKYIPFLEFLG